MDFKEKPEFFDCSEKNPGWSQIRDRFFYTIFTFTHSYNLRVKLIT